MAAGMRSNGDSFTLRPVSEYIKPVGDVALFYGLKGPLRSVFEAYVRAGKHSVLIDLGYWGRHHDGRLRGYHKITVDSYHPKPPLLVREDLGHQRYRLSGGPPLKPSSFDPSGPIIIAGMSAKAAWANYLEPEAYETGMIEYLGMCVPNRIIYRPKPSWLDARPLAGAEFEPSVPLEDLLAGAAGLVTHHSNAALDALAHGIPVHAAFGPAALLSVPDPAEMHKGDFPSEYAVRTLFDNLAYWQWSVSEMEAGHAWRHLKNSGLLK